MIGFLMNWKGYGQKRSWTNLSYYPYIPGGTEESYGNPLRIVNLWAEIEPRTSQI
jgi:hypothetical protein